VPNQQKNIPAEIVAAEELLLEELILWCGQRSREFLGAPRNVHTADQLREFRERLGPSQFLEDAAQMDQEVHAGFGHQRRGLGAQARHPAEDVRIAAQLI